MEYWGALYPRTGSNRLQQVGIGASHCFCHDRAEKSRPPRGLRVRTRDGPGRRRQDESDRLAGRRALVGWLSSYFIFKLWRMRSARATMLPSIIRAVRVTIFPRGGEI
jgi:hypothetical protein